MDGGAAGFAGVWTVWRSHALKGQERWTSFWTEDQEVPLESRFQTGSTCLTRDDIDIRSLATLPPSGWRWMESQESEVGVSGRGTGSFCPQKLMLTRASAASRSWCSMLSFSSIFSTVGQPEEETSTRTVEQQQEEEEEEQWLLRA